MQTEIKNLNSAISALNSIIEAKTNELTSYKAQANHSQKAVFFKQAEINNLTGILNAFIETLQEVETQFLTLQKQINSIKQTVLKYQAGIILNGINLNILTRYTKQPLTALVNEIKLISQAQAPPEIKTTKKPLIGYSRLKQLAEQTKTKDAEFTRELIKNL